MMMYMKYFVIILFYLEYKLLTADTTHNTQITHQIFSKLYQVQGDCTKSPVPCPTECSEILDAFANYASNFTNCSIQHARPIRFCEKCVEQYINFLNKYDQLLTTKINDTTCKSIFLDQDRLDTVEQYYNSISNIWDKGHCDNCFSWKDGIPQLANDTKHFNNMFNETIECITTNLNPYSNNTEQVCEKCMDSYIQLDEFYKTLSTDSIGVDNVCMDIVDSMNKTRFIWSKNLNCCKLRQKPQIIFLCCTAIISSLPIVYYLVVRYCGPIRNLPKVLKESRFKQTFLRSPNNIRINN